jgi:hypothetical protein
MHRFLRLGASPRARDVRSFVPFLPVIVFFAAELWAVQELTFPPDRPMETFHLVAGKTLRGVLDLLFATVVVLSLRRWFVYSVWTVWTIVATVLLHYFRCFDRPLSIVMLLNQWEGVPVALRSAPAVFDWLICATLVGTLGVKVGLYLLARGRAAPPRRVGPLRTLAGAAYVTLLLGLGFFADPLRQFRTHGTMSRMGTTFGYVWSWVGEYAYLGGEELLDRALVAGRSHSDRLLSVEPPLRIPERVVVVQVESLDYEVLDLKIGDEHVTPFLSALRDQSMFFKVRAVHQNGSSDADFVMLMARMPSPDVVTYNIRGYPYADSLPALLSERGYETAAFHGNWGGFFHRDHAFNRMGFSSLYFRGALSDRYGSDPLFWGIPDAAVLDVSKQLMCNEDSRPMFHFVITVTSHAPFDMLPEAERELYLDPSSARENYLNTIRYVDRALQRYVSALPEGTLVILYADHESGVLTSHVDERGRRIEYIPFFIFQPSVNLAEVQRTRGKPITTSGELTLLDLSGYVRNSILSHSSG